MSSKFGYQLADDLCLQIPMATTAKIRTETVINSAGDNSALVINKASELGTPLDPSETRCQRLNSTAIVRERLMGFGQDAVASYKLEVLLHPEWADTMLAVSILHCGGRADAMYSVEATSPTSLSHLMCGERGVLGFSATGALLGIVAAVGLWPLNQYMRQSRRENASEPTSTWRTQLSPPSCSRVRVPVYLVSYSSCL